MLVKRKLLLAVVSAAAICAGALPVTSSADIIFPFPQSLDFCKTASADSTIGLLGSATSNGEAWSMHGLCYRYIVDVSVPGSLRLAVSAGTDKSLTPSACASLSENMSVYWKPTGGAAFTLIGSAHFQGAWSNADFLGGCYAVKTSGSATMFAEAGYPSGMYLDWTPGPGVVRIAATASTNEGPSTITVTAWPEPVI